jgi:XTP/dITP diphosphohydrolase
MRQIIVATHNRDKVAEFRQIFSDVEVTLLTLEEFPSVGPVEEDASTLEGNALKKAREVFRLTGIPALADDTGLEVRYLNDAPGVFSSRYAGAGATYVMNVQKLLRDMKGVPFRRRRARFRSVLAFVPSPETVEVAEGSCHGVILEEPRGSGGFGYDPVFLPDGYSKTFAEMGLDLKNQVSHRARAAFTMREILRRYTL